MKRRQSASMTYRPTLRVRFADVDPAGIVYYPRLVHFFHVAMEDFFGHATGIDYSQYVSRDGLGLPAVRLEADFLRPLRYGDTIETEVEIERVGTTSVTWLYTLYVKGQEGPAVQARVVTVDVHLETLEKRPLPEWLREALLPHLRGSES